MYFRDSFQGLFWNIDYAATAGIILIIILIFTYSKSYINTVQNIHFKFLIWNVFIVNFTDILTAVTLSYGNAIPLETHYILNTIHYMLLMLIPNAYIAYLHAMLNKDSYFTKGYCVVMMPFIISELLIITNPWTKVLFVISHEGYFHNNGYYFLVLTTLFYIICGFVIICRNRKRVFIQQRLCAYSFLFLILIATVIQSAFLTQYLLYYFSAAIAIVIIYLGIQQPDSFLDRATGLQNESGLKMVLEENFALKKDFLLCILKIDNMHAIKLTYGDKAEMAVHMNIIQQITNVIGRKKFFTMDGNRYAMILHEKRRLSSRNKNDLIRKGNGIVEWNGIDIAVYYSAVCIQCPKYAKSYLDAMYLNTFVRRNYISKSTKEIVHVDDKIYQAFERKAKIRTILENALKQNEIQVFYQPVISSENGKVTGAEALARLYDEELGWISPVEFIKIAESDGGIHKLGLQVIEKVCCFLRDYGKNNPELEHISVNLSPVQCMNRNLGKKIRMIIDQYGVDPNKLILEITESEQLIVEESIHELLDSLRSYGIRFSLDDYGTGYSNLSNVIDMHFDIIKIDRSILLDYFNHKNQMLLSLIKMFRDMGYKIVVEGVEEELQAKELVELNVDYLQGFYFSKPIAEEEFLRRYIEKNN